MTAIEGDMPAEVDEPEACDALAEAACTALDAVLGLPADVPLLRVDGVAVEDKYADVSDVDDAGVEVVKVESLTAAEEADVEAKVDLEVVLLTAVAESMATDVDP